MFTSTDSQPGGVADERLRPGWTGPQIVLDPADPDSWGAGITDALGTGRVLVLNFDGIAAAETIADHLRNFGAGIGRAATVAVHPFVTPGMRSGGQVRAVFTDRAPQRPRLRVVGPDDPA